MPFVNTLYTNDNLYVLNGLNSNSVDLIYLDPPFNSKRLYSAPVGSKAAGASFKDMWTWNDVDGAYLEGMINDYPYLPRFISSIELSHGKAMMAYVTYMAQRIIQLHRVLKDTGSIYLHCDPTASHYLKLVMDMVFGKDNFRNEIVWNYDGPQSPSKKKLATKHDSILWYAKDMKKVFVSYNDILFEFEIQGEELQEYKKDDRGYFYDLPPGDYTDASIAKLDAEGRIRRTKNGKIRVKYYLTEENGRYYRIKKMPNVWTDIPSLGQVNANEKVGYPTQKPLALLERIIRAASKEGDIVLDPFCGCATTCVAAQHLNRKWIGIDVEEKSAGLVIDRLSDDFGIFNDFVHRKDIPQRTDIKRVKKEEKGVKESLYKAQKGVCNGCGVKLDIRHFDIDHIVPKAKGGGDYKDNYQLLCGNCNSIKGARPMEYLLNAIKKREEKLKQITFGEDPKPTKRPKPTK